MLIQMKLRVAALFWLTSALAMSAHAQTAQQLLSACKPIAQGEVSEEGIRFARTYETGLCWGLFSMLQFNIVTVDERRRPMYAVCAPETSSRAQLVQIFVKFAESVPARLHEEGNRLALESLRQAFPCTPSK